MMPTSSSVVRFPNSTAREEWDESRAGVQEASHLASAAGHDDDDVVTALHET